MAFRANITYLAGEIATNTIKSVQVKQQRTAVSQLSPRLAGEWFGMPNTTIYLHVSKKYAKFEAGGLAVGAVLGEKVQKIIQRRCQLLPQQALGLQHGFLCIILTILTGFQ